MCFSSFCSWTFQPIMTLLEVYVILLSCLSSIETYRPKHRYEPNDIFSQKCNDELQSHTCTDLERNEAEQQRLCEACCKQQNRSLDLKCTEVKTVFVKSVFFDCVFEAVEPPSTTSSASTQTTPLSDIPDVRQLSVTAALVCGMVIVIFTFILLCFYVMKIFNKLIIG